MNILLLGSTGQVGFELHRTLSPLGVITAPGRKALDLGSEQAVASYLAKVQPGLIFNAAAYTAVDAAEDNHQAIAQSGADHLVSVPARSTTATI